MNNLTISDLEKKLGIRIVSNCRWGIEIFYSRE